MPNPRASTTSSSGLSTNDFDDHVMLGYKDKSVGGSGDDESGLADLAVGYKVSTPAVVYEWSTVG